MEFFKFILTNYGPAIASVCIMIYLCFFTKKSINGNEQKLKDDLSQLIHENAELKVQLKKAMTELNSKVETLNKTVNEIIEDEGGTDERDNKEFKD